MATPRLHSGMKKSLRFRGKKRQPEYYPWLQKSYIFYYVDIWTLSEVRQREKEKHLFYVDSKKK